MRVQQQGQALRLRIDEAELAALLAGGTVENVTRWPDGRDGRQQLALAAQHGWRRNDDGWRMELSDAAVRELAARLPSRAGLSFELAVSGGGALEVLFDVDVRDSVRQRRADKDGKA
ncbi:hypothetical protein ASG87_05455 [Frateuria sp. Soil773]|uniref:hypothetical protein n=1 Tax=Frateuria sp. Soil773 TaxID=1736407 RepID=UPI0006F8A8E2|nr:hypothetical protein [Frateuria sp. Soil773]KRE89000.1 hypothetical protein ASG87_05455 [Frateuria sp. Soil773]